ncbi:MAG: Mov34/MPN/PAD-1 family protein [Candidatus Promineifilaceae bacterium]|nr:Mov34/MPN/PAD-1 family protein [Candidatus Promineifilaceae bacterium]
MKQVCLHGRVSADDLVRLVVSQTALRQIDEHLNQDLSNEAGGALLGSVESDRHRYLVSVDATLPVHAGDRGPVHFTFSADSWAQLQTARAETYPTMEIVGWYHSHPDLGVFFSPDDVIVHSAAFVQPWHVALVIDPVRQEGCFFSRRPSAAAHQPGDLTAMTGFFEKLELESDSLTTWKPLTSALVGHYPTALSERSERRNALASSANGVGLPPVNPWWGVALGGLSLLISLALLIERVLAGLR